jgi:hypothetical protein
MADPAQLRAFWSHRQGLDGSLRGLTPGERAVHEAVDLTEGFVRDQLGDNRGMSLDSPASRVDPARAAAERMSR